jgi:two-component system, LytTR family, sensor kinase
MPYRVFVTPSNLILGGRPPTVSATMRLRLAVLVAVSVCAYALLWTLSVVHYYSMISDPAHLADVVLPKVRIIQHSLLLPLLTSCYFLATMPALCRRRPPLVLATQTALLLTFAILVRPILFLSLQLAPGPGRAPFADFMDLSSWLSTAVNYSLVYALGLFLLFGLIILTLYRREQLRVSEMQANWLQAQLETLRVQLHPHFLFNTLNTVSALVTSRPEEARELIAQLSALLRDSIEGAATEFYPLEREVELANKYLRIIRSRFGARLKLAVEVSEAIGDRLVPRGLLLTLLENAVTHGVSQVVDECQVAVRCALENGRLLVEVFNRYDLSAARKPPHRGGLSALTTRLHALYGEGCNVEYGDDDDGVWHTRVRLPAAAAGLPQRPLDATAPLRAGRAIP